MTRAPTHYRTGGLPEKARRLLGELAASPEASAAYLTGVLELTPATLSRYLRELRQTGYLTGTRVTEAGRQALEEWGRS